MESAVRISERNWVLGLSCVGALAFAATLVSLSHDRREQTLRLERIAVKLDRVRSISPQTRSVVSGLTTSARLTEQGIDEHLENRRKRALDRIDATLSAASVVTSLQPGGKP